MKPGSELADRLRSRIQSRPVGNDNEPPAPAETVTGDPNAPAQRPGRDRRERSESPAPTQPPSPPAPTPAPTPTPPASTGSGSGSTPGGGRKTMQQLEEELDETMARLGTILERIEKEERAQEERRRKAASASLLVAKRYNPDLDAVSPDRQKVIGIVRSERKAGASYSEAFQAAKAAGGLSDEQARDLVNEVWQDAANQPAGGTVSQQDVNQRVRQLRSEGLSEGQIVDRLTEEWSEDQVDEDQIVEAISSSRPAQAKNT